jgi:flavin reductase (DIM6/NTAB) family NADH-FMN oxidoreductase RutF
MHLQWNDRRTRQFITNVGLITSNGPFGPDVMAAEWTHHISYSPSLIAINVRGHDASAHNIIESKEFGINLAGEEQNVACTISGRYSGRDVDKIAVLKGFGVKFYDGNKIDTPMISGCAMNAECKLQKYEEIGDHIMFVGEVVEISADENIRPLIYHNGKYWRLSEYIEKPPSDALIRIAKLVEQFKKQK